MNYYLGFLIFIFFILYYKKIKKAYVILYIYAKSFMRKKDVVCEKQYTKSFTDSCSDKSEEINIDSDEESLPPGSPVHKKHD